MKRRFSSRLSIALLGLVFLAAGCRKEARDDLVYFPNQRPDHLIPILTMNEEAKYLGELIFDGLVNKTTVRDGREQYQWGLVAEDGYREEDPWNRMSITLYLRKDVVWHDGRDFTAADVIYTWQAIRGSNSPLRGWLESFISDMQRVEGNNYKIKVQLNVERSREAFMELFAPIKIMPRSYLFRGERRDLPLNLNDGSEISEEFKFRPVGTGPYRIAERRTQERVRLEYWQNGDAHYYLKGKGEAAAVRRLRMEVESDPIKAVKELKEGGGLLFDVRQEFFPALQEAPLRYQTYLPYSFFLLVFNTARPPFADIRLRQAAAAAVDRGALAGAFMPAGAAEGAVINTAIFPRNSGYVGHDPGGFPDGYTFDPAAAQRRLAGVRPPPFRLLICSQYDGERAVAMAQVFQRQMANLGAAVEIDDASPQMYNRRLQEHDFDVAFCRFSGFDHFYDIRPLFGKGAFNYWQVDDAGLDTLLQEFGRTLDWEKRVDLARRIHSRLQELCPGCYLFTVPRRAYYPAALQNVTIHPEVGFSTVEDWQK